MLEVDPAAAALKMDLEKPPHIHVPTLFITFFQTSLILI